MNKDIELLAPVGSMDALKAAIQNGANAVYLGGKNFNARQYASNFDYDELLEAVLYAHLRDVKVYITLNILLDESELGDAIDYVRYLRKIGVNAIIVQDIGFASIISELFPDIELHASTQMTVNNIYGIEHLERMGFKRVVLAREVPLNELKSISNKTDMELEVFVHGALCFSYSGQCLMSSFIGGRSGNRGRCAQPCRMPYTPVDEKGELLLDWDKLHLLSTRDLNTIEEINDLILSGVKSFKVEGRMKRPEYVATVISAYRKAIDFGSTSISEEEKRDIETIFNRGFTKGLTYGDFGRGFVNVDRPDNRGRIIGKITEVNKRGITIIFNEDASTGDGIEWDSIDGTQNGIKLAKDYCVGETYFFEKMINAKQGSKIRLTSSSKLLSKANETYSKNYISFPIDMKIEIKIDEKPKLQIFYKDFIIMREAEEIVQKAINLSTDKDRIIEQLSKLGDTVFNINSINVVLEEGSFLSIKSLNKLRRDTVKALEELIIQKQKKEDFKDTEYYTKKKELLTFSKVEKRIKKLTIKISDKYQLEQLDLNMLDRIYIPIELYNKENMIKLNKEGIEVYLWTDNILYEKDILDIESKIDNYNGFKGIAVSNIGSFEKFNNRFSGLIHADMGLNIFNPSTAKWFLDNGAKGVTLSSELNLTQIDKIARKIDGEVESLVYGYIPVMITKDCPMAYIKNCKDDNSCKTCNFASGYSLNDRMGKKFRMERRNGFTNIYNSVPIMSLESLPKIEKAGVTNFRLDFTFEKNIKEIQKKYYNYLYNKTSDEEINEFMKEYKKLHEVTNGHFFRGVL
ncbi:MAG: DUF3656 domain-containing protein [Gudongella sp.]|nr:DUF3656 domain-containing protein [Gudongella sp.]